MSKQSWQRRANDSLARLTGYQVVQAKGGASARGREAKPAAATTTAALPAAATKTPNFPADYDGPAQDIIRSVRPFTMTSNDKLFGLISATRYVARHGIPGDIVECGVWRGGSMHAVARALASHGDISRDLHLFDTYEGMPPPTVKDLRHDGSSADALLRAASRDSKVWAVASLEDVREGFTHVPYPAEKVRFVKGLVEDTVPKHAPRQIAILRLDTDWYESTRHELEHLYPRLVSGGVLIIDDYGYWRGSARAVDEFLDKTEERLLLLRASTARIAVKP